MLSTILMFIAAIGLSVVAGYYSVIGMTSIFAGAFLPIIIMTSILETSKVIVASWLYNNWRKTPFALKSYLSIAVVILMGITSMGIFGYLSKAHIEQAAAGQEQQAQLIHIEQQIAAQTAIAEQATVQLNNMSTQGSAQDTAINAKIAEANRQIDSIVARYQPQIADQQQIIDAANSATEARVSSVQSQITDLDNQLANLDAIIKSLIDQQYATKAQAKQAEQKTIRDDIAAQKEQLSQQIVSIRNAPNTTIDTANAAIAKIREQIDLESAKPREVINQLTDKLNQGIDIAKMQSDIDAQNAKIKAAQDEITKLSTEKYKLEGESRKLEVEVGPLKYIAEMIYGTGADASLLEKAVRGVIMIIIVVFDPLAVLMLIAANQGLAEYKTRKTVAAVIVNTDVAPAAMPDPVQPTTQDTAESVADRMMPAIAALQAEIAKLSTSIANSVTVQPAPAEKQVFGDLTESERVEFERFLNNTVNHNLVEPRNHTISFDSNTDNLTIVEETNSQVDEEPIVRLPVVEDDLDSTSNSPVLLDDTKLEWQLIDQLPVVDANTATTTLPIEQKTAAEFLNRLKELYQRNLQQFANNKTEG